MDGRVEPGHDDYLMSRPTRPYRPVIARAFASGPRIVVCDGEEKLPGTCIASHAPAGSCRAHRLSSAAWRASVCSGSPRRSAPSSQRPEGATELKRGVQRSETPGITHKK